MDSRTSGSDADLDLVSRAISFAQRAHHGQLRKDRVTPYAAHPMRVLMLMMRVFKVADPEVLAAAALHDTIEDTTTDRDDLIAAFGERVASYVAELSKDKRVPEAERENRYFDGLAGAPLEVKLLKLGDANTRYIPSYGPVIARKDVQAERDLMLAIFDRMVVNLRLGQTADDMLKAGLLDGLPRTFEDPKKFLYDAHKGFWAHHNKLMNDIV